VFYKKLRGKGYRAQVIRNMYLKAKDTVKSALNNGAKNKPMLKKSTA